MLFFFFHYRFNPAELAFLEEYATVISPVARATNIFQAEVVGVRVGGGGFRTEGGGGGGTIFFSVLGNDTEGC